MSEQKTEGWAFLSPEGVGAHYFRDGRSFCGRPLPASVEVRGDVFGAGSDPEECRRCAKRAMDEADALDAAEEARMDAEDEQDRMSEQKTLAEVLAELREMANAASAPMTCGGHRSAGSLMRCTECNARSNAHVSLGRMLTPVKVINLIQGIEPCNRCGERLIINPKPHEDIVVCEQCAFSEGKEHVLAHLASERVVEAVATKHRRADGLLEQFDPEYREVTRGTLAALREVLGGEA